MAKHRRSLLVQEVSSVARPPTFYYLPIAGRGELTRLIAAAGGLELDEVMEAVEDADAVQAQWKETKICEKFSSPGTLPVMAHGDLKLAQSFAIESYIAELAPCFASLTPAQRAVDAMFGRIKEDMCKACKDIIDRVTENEQLCKGVDAEKVDAAKEQVKQVGDKWFPALVGKLPATGFINGLAFPTPADLAVLNIAVGFMPFGAAYGLGGYDTFAKYPDLAVHVDRVSQFPAVKAYLDTSTTIFADPLDLGRLASSKPPCLYYFPFAGSGELSRLIAAAGGVQIEDVGEPSDKANFGEPYLCHGELQIAQSFVIESYMASIAPQFKNLTPDQLAVDSMFCKVKEDAMQSFMGVLEGIMSDDSKRASAAKDIARIGDQFIPILLGKLPQVGFVNGLAFPTAADLAVLNMARGFMPFGAAYQIGSYDAAAKHPKFATHAKRVARYPPVKAYLARSRTIDADPLDLRSFMLRPPPSPMEHDAKLTLATVDALAVAMAQHLGQGDVPEAVALLQQAISAYSDDAESHGETAPSMMARASMHLLLCTALSQGGCHDLAYKEAQASATKMDEVWGSHLLGSLGSDGKTPDSAQALREFLSTPPPWLVRAVELAVQARQCAATELEYMRDWEMEEEGPACFASDETSASLCRRLWEQIAQLHTEAVQLASQLLEEGHPIRIIAEGVLERWLARGPSGEEEQPAPRARRLQRVQTPVLAGMLAGRSGPVDDESDSQDGGRAWRSLAPASMSCPALPKINVHERLHQGLAPEGRTPEEVRRQRRRAALDAGLSGSCVLSSSGGASGSGSAGSSMVLSGSEPPLKESSSDHQLRGAAKKSLLQSTSLARRRVPISMAMDGPGGKASWALRGAQNRPKRTATGKEVPVSPFEDWLNASAGPQKSLGSQVTGNDEYLKKFRQDLAEKSRMFKHFWMKEEVNPDNLYDMRIKFTEEGIRVSKKSLRKYPKVDVKPSPPAAGLTTLFNHYGVQQSKKTEPGLKSLGALLQKSNESLRRTEARSKKAPAPKRD